jgi:hypothetical protein
MVKPECQDIADELQDTRVALAIAQQDFLEAERNSQEKQRLKKEVVRLLDRVRELEGSLRDCEGLPPYPQPVRALFTCTAIVRTSSAVLPTSTTSNIPAAMTFSDVFYRLVEFTFPDTVVGGVAAGVGPATVTNSISARTVSTVVGVFEQSSGHIDIPSASFDVRQSLAFTENGTVTFTPLTTRTVSSPSAPSGTLMGMPLDRSVTPGRVVLVGSSVLVGAVCFRGTAVDLILDGVLSGFPPPQ